jgi:hypothetical protein
LNKAVELLIFGWTAWISAKEVVHILNRHCET